MTVPVSWKMFLVLALLAHCLWSIEGRSVSEGILESIASEQNPALYGEKSSVEESSGDQSSNEESSVEESSGDSSSKEDSNLDDSSGDQSNEEKSSVEENSEGQSSEDDSGVEESSEDQSTVEPQEETNSQFYQTWYRSLNTSVDPCQDFYEFACGRFIAERKQNGHGAAHLKKWEIQHGLDTCLLDALKSTKVSDSIAIQHLHAYRDLVVRKGNFDLSDTHEATVMTNKLITFFPILVNNVFREHCFDSDTTAQAKEMAKEIKTKFVDLIKESIWMDQTTKNAALAKLKATKIEIGVSDHANDLTWLDSVYENLELNEGLSLDQIELELTKFNTIHFEASDDDFSPTEVNAFHHRGPNSIKILIGELNRRRFGQYLPASIKYSTVGVTISHEYGHLFDSEGVYYDATGKNRLWLTLKSKRNFKTYTDCVVDQYDDEMEPEIGRFVDGTRTLAENMADNLGIRAAYNAFVEHLEEYEVENVQGYEDYTPEQAFFISYATDWCFAGSKSDYKNQLRDTHATSRARVNVPLRNFASFGEAFNCPLDSAMYPQTTCEVW